jgi:polysaccharide export outer membrane protein
MKKEKILDRRSNWLSIILLVPILGILSTSCTGTSSSTNGLSPTNDTVKTHAVKDGELRIVEDLPPPQNTRQGVDQLIAENDVLKINIFQVSELDRTVRVDSNGQIKMPLIGTMKVAGKTIPVVELEMEKKYNTKYLQASDITIHTKNSAGQKITMDGEFNKPNIYPSTSTSTLLQAVALAGGLSRIADEGKIFVFRQYKTQKLVANYSIEDIRAGKSRDPRLFGGDVVVAFTSKSKIATENLKDALGIALSATRLAVPF